MSWNLGASNSWNPQGLSRPVMGCFTKSLNRHTPVSISIDILLQQLLDFQSTMVSHNTSLPSHSLTPKFVHRMRRMHQTVNTNNFTYREFTNWIIPVPTVRQELNFYIVQCVVFLAYGVAGGAGEDGRKMGVYLLGTSV